MGRGVNYDCIIVGGGVAGSVLAGLLGRQGKKVLLLEKTQAPSALVRPEIIWPATTKVLASLIPAKSLAADVLLPLGSVEVLGGRGESLLLSRAFLQRAGIERCSLEPNHLCQQLLSLDSFELRRGMEVTGVLRDRGRVMGVRSSEAGTDRQHEFLARYTVGNDGAHSFVRQECGLPMRTRIFPIDFLCFGFKWPRRFEGPTTRVWFNTGDFASGILALFALPLPNGRGAGLVAVRPWIFDRPGDTQQRWSRFCEIDIGIQDVMGARRFPNDLVRIRRPWGHAPRYGCDGMIVMGDAAHPVSPIGGQGTNMAVADAATFADLLRRNVPDPLEEYTRFRRPANRRSLRFTRNAARLLQLPTYCLPGFALRVAFRWVCRHPSSLVSTIQYASTAFRANNRHLPPGSLA